MENKDKYLKAMIKADGHFDEIDLGEILGFDEEETRLLISRLLSEYKIEYSMNGLCNYKVKNI